MKRLDRRLFVKASCSAALGGITATLTAAKAGAVEAEDFHLVEGAPAGRTEPVTFLMASARKPACEIVLPSGASEMTRHAASRLQSVIAEISGVKVAIVPENRSSASQGRILVGTFAENRVAAQLLREKQLVVFPEDRDKQLSKRTMLPEHLGEQGFVLYAGDYQAAPALAVTAYTPLGVLYAVETLSDRLYLEDDALVAGPLNSMVTPILNLPAFRCRSIATNFGGPEWYAGGQWEKEWAKPDGSGYDWRGFVDWMASHKINNLNVWIFGLPFGIAYDSKRFPELVNRYHPNVKHEFMTELIDYAHSRGIRVFTMINFPDGFTPVIKRYPELAGKNVNLKDIPDGQKWEEYLRLGQGVLDEADTRELINLETKCSWVCASEPKTMHFWRSYLEDLFEHYPKLDGIGGQFAEDDYIVCNCDRCRGHHFAIFEKYFSVMVEVARRHNPKIACWVYDSWGTRDIVEHQDRYPNFIDIDWSGLMAGLSRREYLPRSKWYLFHREASRFPDFAYKYGASILNERGQEGMEIRVVAYKSWDNAVQAFEEFGWNPRLTIEEYAELYIQKVYRRRDPQLAKLYESWLKFPGYLEMVSGREGDNGTYYQDPTAEEDRALAAKAKATLAQLLDQIPDHSDLVELIRRQFAAMNHPPSNT
ncbi:MAG TPA: family 20 glycosylhydrolase [Alloacidobacterium sp.]|nr:family 20 glycosylhydrolase [Alloacidobacterium sp.]